MEKKPGRFYNPFLMEDLTDMIEKVMEYHLHTVRKNFRITLYVFILSQFFLMTSSDSFLFMVISLIGLLYCIVAFLYAYIKIVKKGLYSEESFLFQSLPVSTKDFFTGKILALIFYSSSMSLVFYLFATVSVLFGLITGTTLPSQIFIDTFGFHENSASLILTVCLSYIVQATLTFAGGCLITAVYVMLSQIQIAVTKKHRFEKGNITFFFAFIISSLIANLLSMILDADLTCFLASAMSLFETIIVSVAVGLFSFIYVCKNYRKTVIASPYC